LASAHGGIKSKTPISRLGLTEDNLLRPHLNRRGKFIPFLFFDAANFQSQLVSRELNGGSAAAMATSSFAVSMISGSWRAASAR
jgi:hypothetical protein